MNLGATTVITNKKRGAKPKDFLERLIPKVWYWHVRSRTSWSDSDLDVEFVRRADGDKYIKTERIRTFEAIRKNGRTPSKGTHNLRSFDLVALVDVHPDFSGTASSMNSPFWVLLRAHPRSLDRATQLVERCFSIFKLRRLDTLEEMLWSFDNSDLPLLEKRPEGITKGSMSNFEVKLLPIVKMLPDSLDSLALLGSLYREACLSFNPKNAEILGRYFDKLLIRFCSQPWLNAVASDLEDIARQRILYGDYDYVPNLMEVQQRRYMTSSQLTTGMIVKEIVTG